MSSRYLISKSAKCQEQLCFCYFSHMVICNCLVSELAERLWSCSPLLWREGCSTSNKPVHLSELCLSLCFHKLTVFGHFSVKVYTSSHSFPLSNIGLHASWTVCLGWNCSSEQQYWSLQWWKRRGRNENVEITVSGPTQGGFQGKMIII